MARSNRSEGRRELTEVPAAAGEALDLSAERISKKIEEMVEARTTSGNRPIGAPKLGELIPLHERQGVATEGLNELLSSLEGELKRAA